MSRNLAGGFIRGKATRLRPIADPQWRQPRTPVIRVPMGPVITTGATALLDFRGGPGDRPSTATGGGPRGRVHLEVMLAGGIPVVKRARARISVRGRGVIFHGSGVSQSGSVHCNGPDLAGNAPHRQSRSSAATAWAARSNTAIRRYAVHIDNDSRSCVRSRSKLSCERRPAWSRSTGRARVNDQGQGHQRPRPT
jgi:hypothetical protein